MLGLHGIENRIIKTALACGDLLSALRVASRFHDRSNETLTFKRGFDAYQNPDFYRLLGQSPDEIILGTRTAAGLLLPIGWWK
jgi:hypothetical protein